MLRYTSMLLVATTGLFSIPDASAQQANPDADAIVLLSSTDVSFDMRPDLDYIVYSHKVRIKIVNDNGLDAANICIPYFDVESSNAIEGEVSDIRATTFNTESGKTIESKLSPKNIKTERISQDHFQMTFTAPDAKVGSIIEYEYKRASAYYLSPDTWYAQCQYPVELAEYSFCMPDWFTFTSRVGGSQLLVPEVKHATFRSKLSYSAEPYMAAAIRVSFKAENLPALDTKGQPIKAIKDAIRVEHDLKEIRMESAQFRYFDSRWEQLRHRGQSAFFDDETGEHHFGYRLRDYLTSTGYIGNFIHYNPIRRGMTFNDSWALIALSLLKDDEFGLNLTMTNPLAEQQKALALTVDMPLAEKLIKLRQLLLKNYLWNGSYSLFSNGKIATSQGTKLNMGAMNFVMLSMLRDAGISAMPIVFSRRSKGMMASFASTRYVNTMCIRVKTADGGVIYLDPTTNDYNVGTLPPDMRFIQAIAISPEGSRVVELKSADEFILEDPVTEL